MKRFLAYFVALTIVMSLVSCGKNSSDEKTKSKKSEKGTAAQSAVSEDASDKSKTDFSDESDIETQLKDLLQKKIDAAINDDFDAYCSYSPENIVIKIDIAEGDYNEEDVTDEMIEDYEKDILEEYESQFNSLKDSVGNGNTTVKDFEITEFEKEGDIKVITASFTLENNENNTNYALFFVVENEVELSELEFNYEDRSDLKSANSYAKAAYNIAAEYLADMEIQGFSRDEVLYEEGGEIDCTSVSYSNKLSEKISEYFCEYDDGGVVYVDTCEDGFYVQWKSSHDSEVVGQYPNPNGDVNNHYTWGSYGNYQ